MPIGKGRDFPAWSADPGVDSAQSLLDDIGGLQFGTRWVSQLAREYPTICTSGGVEGFLVEYRERGLHRGGQRWPPLAVSGYVTIDGAAELVDRSRGTIYNWVRQGRLEAVRVEDRTMVSLGSLGSLQLHPVYNSSRETATVTVLYRDGGISGVVAESL